MPVTPTTKLDAVNYLLSIVGESPVAALNTDENASASVAIATELIDEVDRMVQSRGWGFNTASLFQFNKSGSEFPVTSDTLRVNILATSPSTNLIQRFVLRNEKIYDSTYGTFTNPVIPGTATQYTALLGERVFLVDFTELPQSARQYITIRAGRMFLQRVLPDEASNKISEIDEQMAFAMLIEWEIKSGRNTDYSKFSTELEALGINLAVFTNASIEDKSKLVKLSGESLTERQGREYYETRIKGKTTLTTDTYAAYKDNFNRLGITEKDFIQLDPILREELMVIAKNTTTTADTRASKFFQSTNASKASKLGIRYSDFLKFTREEQQVFLDGVASLSDDRFSRFIAVQAKANRIGVRITDFFAYKPEEQELFLDALASASYSDTRATDYVTRKASLDRLGIKPTDFFALKQEDQSNLLEAVANVSFTDTRVTNYVTNQAKLKALGVYPTDFFALSYDQQTLVLDAVNSGSYTENRASDYVTNRDKLRKLNINAVDFFSLKPDQQNQLLSVVSSASFDETRASSYITNQDKLKRIGIYPADFFALKPDQQFLLLETINSAGWTDTRASSYFTNQDRFRKLGIEPADFFALKPEQQVLLNDNIASYTETRATSYITNQAKLKRIGIWPGEFYSLKPDQQNLLLDAINSASWSDTRATDYVTNQAKFKTHGIYPADFFALKPDQQTLLLETLPTFTEDRSQQYLALQESLQRKGLTILDFIALPKDQQALLLEAHSFVVTKTCNVTEGDFVVAITIGGITNLSVGQIVTGSGIFPGTYVSEIVGNTSFKVSKAPFSNNLATTLTFRIDNVQAKNQILLKGNNLRTLIKAGVNINEFIALNEKQQYQLLDLVEGFQDSSRYQGFVVKVDQFKLRGITLKDFLALKPSEQQNLVDSAGSLEASITTSQVSGFENTTFKVHLNDVIMAVGLNPAQDYNRDYINKAHYIFEQVLKDVQAMGWHYNTDIQDFTAVGDGNGNFKRIVIGSSILSVDTDKYGDYHDIDPVIRWDSGAGPHSAGRFLWDRKNNKWVDKDLKNVEVVKNLEIDSIPSHILKYAKMKAAKELAYNLNNLTNSPDLSVKNAFLVQEEARSRADAIEEDSKQGDYSIFDNYSVSNILDR